MEVSYGELKTVLIKGLEEVNKENIREQVEKLFRHVLEETEVNMNLETIKQIGRKRENNKSRSILVKFSDYGDKEKIIYSGKCNINPISVEDNFSPNAFKKIQLVQNNFIKYVLNLPKQCSNYISRSEVGKFLLNLKIWSQMVKYFIRLKQGTNNKILNDASICAAQINTRWMQTLSRLLKTNGFADVLSNPQNLSGDQLSKQFLQRCKDNKIITYKASLLRLKQNR